MQHFLALQRLSCDAALDMSTSALDAALALLNCQRLEVASGASLGALLKTASTVTRALEYSDPSAREKAIRQAMRGAGSQVKVNEANTPTPMSSQRREPPKLTLVSRNSGTASSSSLHGGGHGGSQMNTQMAAAVELARHQDRTTLKEQHAPLELPSGCQLRVGIEYCTAARPSRNGSLRGSSEAYVLHRDRVAQLIQRVLCPWSNAHHLPPGSHVSKKIAKFLENTCAALVVANNEPLGSKSPAAGGKGAAAPLPPGPAAPAWREAPSAPAANQSESTSPSVVRDSRPSTALRAAIKANPSDDNAAEVDAADADEVDAARPRARAVAVSPASFAPRIGAFEVAILLRAPTVEGRPGKTYGPVVVFSKLATGRWPQHDRLAEQIRLHVQDLVGEYSRQPESQPRCSPREAAFGSRSIERVQAQVPPSKAQLKERVPAPPPPPSEPAMRPPPPPPPAHDKWAEMNAAAVDALARLYPLEVPTRHSLRVHFECCTAPRPGRNGSLRGSSKTYDLHLQHLKRHIREMLPAAEVVVNVAEETSGPQRAAVTTSLTRSESAKSSHHVAPPQVPLTWQRVAATSASADSLHSKRLAPKRHQATSLSKEASITSKRAGWERYLSRNELVEWMAPKQPHRMAPKLPARAFAPRIGSFELTVTLIGPTTNATIGPVLIFSKLASPSSGAFPLHDEVLIRLHRHAQELIRVAQRPGGSAFHPLYMVQEVMQEQTREEQAAEQAPLRGSASESALLPSQRVARPAPSLGSGDLAAAQRYEELYAVR